MKKMVWKLWNPVATILPTISVANFRPAPVVAFFSSRGPASNTPNLLKSDIGAPGNAILAAWPKNDTEVTLPGQEPPLFNIVSGTSMSCAHVSGIAATLKSQNPTWSPTAIRSAIMTTGKSHRVELGRAGLAEPYTASPTKELDFNRLSHPTLPVQSKS
ncbi:hypothetical protein RND71_038748 [Anisodus tanguticus]|uniref:Peptidase S8/S53 domain-containing protein n=1 Tax=Anisodus tanguticus TaxID=243964 RepID=A0AAE1R396_9SOLA|nr:hypothetical protein RND71_038748 [Anisodus tanguticus]